MARNLVQLALRRLALRPVVRLSFSVLASSRVISVFLVLLIDVFEVIFSRLGLTCLGFEF